MTVIQRSTSPTSQTYSFVVTDNDSMANASAGVWFQSSDTLFARWAIPAPGKPLFEAAAANFDPHSPAKVDTANEMRGPLLLIMGGRDHTVPESVTRATLKQYRHSHAVTDIKEFADRAHSLTVDHGWRDVADYCLAWLKQQGL